MNTEDSLYLKEISLLDTYRDDYWCGLPFFRDLQNGKKFSFETPVTFFVGENGCGKSTLTEAIAVALGYNAEGGSKNFNFKTRDTTSALWEDLRLVRNQCAKDGFFLRAESFYNVATDIENLHLNLSSYGGKSLHRQSHGESFLALVQNRFRGNGLYILDEPEAALSPMRQLTLMVEMNRLVQNGSQFLIATHSPILLTYPQAKIYALDRGISELDYTETEHYQLTRNYLNNPDAFLQRLFSDKG